MAKKIKVFSNTKIVPKLRSWIWKKLIPDPGSQSKKKTTGFRILNTHWLRCAGTGGADQLGAGGAAGGVSGEDVPHLHYPGVQPCAARAHTLLLQPGQAVHSPRPLQQDAGPGQPALLFLYYEIKVMKVLQRDFLTRWIWLLMT